MSNEDQVRACFFYGTLMAPSVFARVISGQVELDKNIVIHDAVLHDYQRHAIKQRDYPAIKAQKGHTVLGRVAYDLDQDQISKLDVFEGDEYSRTVVEILDTFTQQMVKAYAYVWDPKLVDQLLQENWNFNEFVSSKMQNWIADEMDQVENDPRGARFWNPAKVQQR